MTEVENNVNADSANKVNIVGVRFKRAGRIYYFDPAGLELKVKETVVVTTARGLKVGEVAIAPEQVLASQITGPLKPIVRKAETEDIKRTEELAQKEINALAEASALVNKIRLPMKLLSTEFSLDSNHLTIFFKAAERVDFRELVRELIAHFKVRVELRQVGPRDEAKLVGGYGRCGRPLCCAHFLDEFAPVSIKMAKEQNLPLNPMKIAGSCGRLLCCLAYESELTAREKAKAASRSSDGSTEEAGLNTVIKPLPVKTEGQPVGQGCPGCGHGCMAKPEQDSSVTPEIRESVTEPKPD